MAFKGIQNPAIFFKDKKVGPRKPKRTFTEMAEEFCVTTSVLRAAMKDPFAPKPVLISRNPRTCTNSYYDPDEMRKWWRARGDHPAN